MSNNNHKFLVKEIDFSKMVNKKGSEIKVKYKEFDHIKRKNGALADQWINEEKWIHRKKINFKRNLEDKINDIDRDIDLLAEKYVVMEDDVAVLFKYLHEHKGNENFGSVKKMNVAK